MVLFNVALHVLWSRGFGSWCKRCKLIFCSDLCNPPWYHGWGLDISPEGALFTDDDVHEGSRSPKICSSWSFRSAVGGVHYKIYSTRDWMMSSWIWIHWTMLFGAMTSRCRALFAHNELSRTEECNSWWMIWIFLQIERISSKLGARKTSASRLKLSHCSRRPSAVEGTLKAWQSLQSIADATACVFWPRPVLRRSLMQTAAARFKSPSWCASTGWCQS